MSRNADLIDFHTTSNLRGLSKLLESWTRVVVDFCHHDSEDNCWWSNERASLSTLAGAAWRLKGWVALEEFSTTKRHGSQSSKRHNPGDSAQGRCDLYVSNPSTSFAMEAKQAWPRFGDGDRDYKDAIAEAMKKAEKDARSLTADEADIRLAITFAAPSIRFSKIAHNKDSDRVDRAKTRELVEKWIRHSKLNEYNAWAYVFPANCRGLVSTSGKSLFPGVVLTMKQIKRGHRVSRKPK